MVEKETDRDGGNREAPDDPSQQNMVSPGELEAQDHALLPPSPGRTLLPAPFARAVSLAARSTGFALRVGTFIGGYGLGAAKVTTLSSLELGRGILEGILSRAGKDVQARSTSELGRADAETALERSLESLHTAMTQVVFWTTTGFHLTDTAMSTMSELSQLTLSFLDSFLGSTESSRAIASIITLIRREFNNPATGQPGEKVGVLDLIIGISGLAYLQRWSWKLIEEENRRLGVDEILWDVVILNEDERLDVHQEGLYGVHPGNYQKSSETDDSPSQKVIETIQRHGAHDSDDDSDSLPEIRLKRHIMNALPADAKVSITTETKTIKTVTVDVQGTQPGSLDPPPGVEVIEETRLRPATPGNQSSEQPVTPGQPTYRVVYRVNKNKLRSTEIARGPDQEDVPRYVEQINDDDSDNNDTHVSDEESEDMPPPPPPKSPKMLRQASSLEALQQADLRTSPTLSRQNQTAPSTTRRMSRSSDKSSHIPLPGQSPETSANQKRPRMPMSPTNSSSSFEQPSKRQNSMQSMSKLLSKKPKTEPSPSSSSTDKKGGLRNVLKRGPGSTLSNLVGKDNTGSSPSLKGKQPAKGKSTTGALRNTPQIHRERPSAAATATKRAAGPNRDLSLVPRRDAPRPPQGNTKNHLTARALAEYEATGAIPRSPSRASYISVHERRRDSLVSQTDTYSLHSPDNYRPVSPTFVRTDHARQSSIAKSRSERDVPDKQPPSSPLKSHRRVQSQLYSPSIYTLKTTDSQTSLVPYYHRSPFGDAESLMTLRRTGTLDVMFPRFHILRNITRFMRFSSAAYGSSFLRMMGISKAMPSLKVLDNTHHELRSFAHHTQSQPQSILLSSFVDTQGGSDSSGSTNTGVPLVHYISLDDESKAVVLACRGTLGFEDVLADMTCDYDDLVWRGKSYKVHKGIHASARRLVYGGDGRVLVTIKAALEQNPDYGLVLTGHSLGGAVTALLGVMLSEPAMAGTSFVTSDEPHSRLLLPAPSSGLSDDAPASSSHSHICLPSGRPIHVFAYGPPATMSPSLCKATRGLITSVVHGQDLVPYLSLGVLHDFQAVALAFKTDNNDAKQEVRQRIWEAFQTGLADKWYSAGASSSSSSSSSRNNKARQEEKQQDDEWAFAAFKTLRASMMSTKLLPPGEVFLVEATQVLRRDAFVGSRMGDNTSASEAEKHPPSSEAYIGRPARRIVLRYVRDVEARFREVRFGASMLTDHSPGKYEDALDGLRFGVVES